MPNNEKIKKKEKHELQVRVGIKSGLENKWHAYSSLFLCPVVVLEV
jgi:hypothetical protein